MRAVLAAVSLLALLQDPRPSTLSPGPDAPAIYSARPDDPWNRLFAALFTRTVRTRFTSEFADRGPFQPAPPDLIPAFVFHQPAMVSTRVFDRFEEGDRAIDALYPAFLNQTGPHDALREPLHGELVAALDGALADRTDRSPLARVLMQVDLWSAFDPLEAIQDGHDTAAARQAAGELTARLAKLIGRVALAPKEIGALANNYEAARRAEPLPDLFNPGGPWIEIVWGQDRMHDAEEQFRRSSRVFVRPIVRPPDTAAFLKTITTGPQPPVLAATALVMQVVAIDRSGRAVPTPLIRDVQIRTFARDTSGAVTASMSEYELSRRRLLSNPSDGFLQFDDRAEAYLATAGNDYGFATPDLAARKPPTIATLHTRCLLCHGPDGAHVMSFAVTDPALMPQPRALPQPNDERARYVAQKKEARGDFTRLVALAGLR
jgi:hypothetical protein